MSRRPRWPRRADARTRPGRRSVSAETPDPLAIHDDLAGPGGRIERGPGAHIVLRYIGGTALRLPQRLRGDVVDDLEALHPAPAGSLRVPSVATGLPLRSDISLLLENRTD